MKRIIILVFAVVNVFSVFCQTSLQDGDRCFDKGDYVCAETKYSEAFRLATGRDKQIAEIKLTRTKWCGEHISTANQAFTSKNYKAAKENYQNVLESNPEDVYAKTQLEKCNNFLNPQTITLSVSKETLSFQSSGGSESITVYTNASSYSVYLLPSWCSVQKYAGYFVITCGANSLSTSRADYFNVITGGKSVRINVSQSSVTKKMGTTLTLSKGNLSYPSSGGNSEAITVYSNASTYSFSFVPSWCTVQKFSNYFIVSCSANNWTQARSDWFKVIAEDKEVIVYINQSGTTNSSKYLKCFNCPNAKYTWGISAGYIQKSNDNTEGIQLGLRIEPLFKYGFGLNTGLNFEGYTTDLLSIVNQEHDFGQYSMNIPLHLEYRLNFSKWFNIFAYGGVGLNIVTNSLFDDYSTQTTVEYGGGVRINHFQFNLGQSLYMGNFENLKYLEISKEAYQDLIMSVSWMF